MLTDTHVFMFMYRGITSGDGTPLTNPESAMSAWLMEFALRCDDEDIRGFRVLRVDAEAGTATVSIIFRKEVTLAAADSVVRSLHDTGLSGASRALEPRRFRIETYDPEVTAEGLERTLKRAGFLERVVAEP